MGKIKNRPEQSLQLAVAKFLDLALPKDSFWFHVPNAARRGMVEAVMMKRLGMKSGVPDIVIVWQGRCYFIELKSSDGVLSVTQAQTIDALTRCGAKVAIARSLSQVENLLREWKFELRLSAS